MWANEVVAPRNYRAAARMAKLTPRPHDNIWRYLTARGKYPYSPEVRTPIGPVRPTLYSFHDMMTFNEIFVREDYACPEDAKVVVDLGSNIGISALYFLSRNRDLRCWLYEPVPANLARLRANLVGFQARYQLHETAVGMSAGQVTFNVEPSGRYGGIGVATEESITVECTDVNALLADVLDEVKEIDVLKLDIEGLELGVLQAIDRTLLQRIRLIYLEWQERNLQLVPDLFDAEFFNETYRLSRRSLPQP